MEEFEPEAPILSRILCDESSAVYYFEYMIVHYLVGAAIDSENRNTI